MKLEQDFSIYELFTIREALSLLAEKVQKDGDEFDDFTTISDLEKYFTQAHYSAKGLN